MTRQQLAILRKYLERVVPRGPDEQDEFIAALNGLDLLLQGLNNHQTAA